MDYPQRKRMRLSEYDYTTEGAYFVTICSNKRLPILGRITDGIMILNSNGKIVRESWLELPIIYSSVRIDMFVVMPNHFHGILFLVGAGSSGPQDKPMTPSLSTVIAHFKHCTTTKINDLHHAIHTKRWQRGFYEHVVRNEEEIYKIREYIQNNPMKWQIDRYYSN